MIHNCSQSSHHTKHWSAHRILSTSQTKTKIIRTLRKMVDIWHNSSELHPYLQSMISTSQTEVFSATTKMHTRHGCPCHSTHYQCNIISNKLPAPSTQLPVSKIGTAPEQRVHHHHCNCCYNHWQPTIFSALIQYYSQKLHHFDQLGQVQEWAHTLANTSKIKVHV